MTIKTDSRISALNAIWDWQWELYQSILTRLVADQPEFLEFAAQLNCTTIQAPDLTVTNQGQIILRWAESPVTIYAHFLASQDVEQPMEAANAAVREVLQALDLQSSTLRGAEIELLILNAPEEMSLETAEILWLQVLVGIKAGVVEQDEAIQSAFENCPSQALVEIAVNRARRQAEAQAEHQALQERAGGVMSLLAGVVDTNRAAAMTRQHLAANPAS